MCKFEQYSSKIHFLCIVFKLIQNTCIGADASKDAKEIVDSKFAPKTIEEILLYRTQEECIEINEAIVPFIGGKPWVDPKYIPSETSKPYDDLLFALVNDSMTVFSMYLGKYFDLKDETFIIMIFIQIDDREKVKKVYGDQHDHSFDKACKKQRRPFQNALIVWAKANRYPDKTGCFVDTCEVGQELEDLRYVQNGDTYLAQVLHDHCDGKDNWSMWIIILTTRRGDPMKSIDEAFQSQYKNVTLKNYIKTCNVQDPLLKDMLTILADSSSASKRQPPPPPPPPEKMNFEEIKGGYYPVE